MIPKETATEYKEFFGKQASKVVDEIILVVPKDNGIDEKGKTIPNPTYKFWVKVKKLLK